MAKTFTREYESPKERDKDVQKWTKQGWRVQSVNVIPGHERVKRGLGWMPAIRTAPMMTRTKDRYLVVYER